MKIFQNRPSDKIRLKLDIIKKIRLKFDPLMKK